MMSLNIAAPVVFSRGIKARKKSLTSPCVRAIGGLVSNIAEFVILHQIDNCFFIRCVCETFVICSRLQFCLPIFNFLCDCRIALYTRARKWSISFVGKFISAAKADSFFVLRRFYVTMTCFTPGIKRSFIVPLGYLIWFPVSTNLIVWYLRFFLQKLR